MNWSPALTCSSMIASKRSIFLVCYLVMTHEPFCTGFQKKVIRPSYNVKKMTKKSTSSIVVDERYICTCISCRISQDAGCWTQIQRQWRNLDVNVRVHCMRMLRLRDVTRTKSGGMAGECSFLWASRVMTFQICTILRFILLDCEECMLLFALWDLYHPSICDSNVNVTTNLLFSKSSMKNEARWGREMITAIQDNWCEVR